MRLLEHTWSGIPGTIYTTAHILFYSSALSLSSCDLPPFLSLLMSSILPHLPLVSPTLFSSELLSLAVCLACDGPEAAMLSSPVSLLFFLLPCPDPAILSTHTHTRSLSLSFILFLPVPRSLHHPCLRLLPHALRLLFPLRPLSAIQPSTMSVKDTE